MGNSHNALSVDLDDPVPDLMMIIVNIIIIIMNDDDDNNDDDMETNPDSSTLSDSSS